MSFLEGMQTKKTILTIFHLEERFTDFADKLTHNGPMLCRQGQRRPQNKLHGSRHGGG